MRYRLRTLLIVLAVVPPLLAGVWFIGEWLTYEPPTAEDESPILFTPQRAPSLLQRAVSGEVKYYSNDRFPSIRLRRSVTVANVRSLRPTDDTPCQADALNPLASRTMWLANSRKDRIFPDSDRADVNWLKANISFGLSIG